MVVTDVQQEGLKLIQIPPNTAWCCGFKCSCGEVAPKKVFLSADEMVEQTAGKQQAVHLNYKCKLCEKTATVTIVPRSEKGAIELPEDEGERVREQSIVQFDCRGGVLTEWEVGDVVAVGRSGQEFAHDMRGGELADYDDAAGRPVALYAVTAAFK